MTTSKSKKFSAWIKHLFSSGETTSEKEVHSKFEVISRKWWFHFLPWSVISLLIDYSLKTKNLESRCKSLVNVVAEQNSILVTYQNNAKAQKEKTKRYSELRKQARDRKRISSVQIESMNKLVGHYHEHEEGL